MNVDRRILELERRVAQLERERDDLIARAARLSGSGVRVAIFELSGSLAKGGSCTAYLLDLNSSDELVHAGSGTVVVYDLVETFVGGDGKMGVAVEILGKWVVIQLQC